MKTVQDAERRKNERDQRRWKTSSRRLGPIMMRFASIVIASGILTRTPSVIRREDPRRLSRSVAARHRRAAIDPALAEATGND
jgi:hypothetical protein